MIAKGHFSCCSRCAVAVQCITGNCDTGTQKPRDLLVQVNDSIINRNIVFVLLDVELHENIACFLELRCHHIILLGHIHRKGYQGRRYINVLASVLIGSGHGILTADGRNAIAKLCIISAQKRCKRLAPALRILAHPAEELLEGEMQRIKGAAAGNDLRNGLCHGINGSMIRAPAGQIRIKAIAHHGYRVRLAAQNRKLRHH